MRHARGYRRLNRTHEHRKALWGNMAGSLIEHEQIKTTLPKAKELRPIIEKLVTLAKRGDIHARRQAASQLKQDPHVAKLFDVIGPRYASRQGAMSACWKARVPLWATVGPRWRSSNSSIAMSTPRVPMIAPAWPPKRPRKNKVLYHLWLEIDPRPTGGGFCICGILGVWAKKKPGVLASVPPLRVIALNIGLARGSDAWRICSTPATRRHPRARRVRWPTGFDRKLWQR